MAADTIQAVSVQGTQLGYKKSSESSFTYLEGLLTLPAMGSKPEKVDQTTMNAGGYKRYRPAALKDYDDLDFKFITGDVTNAESNYRVLKAIEAEGKSITWSLKYSIGLSDEFTGKCAVVIDSFDDLDANHTFTLTLYPDSVLTENYSNT